MIDVIVIGYKRPEETYLTIESLLEANDDIKVILIHNGYTQKASLKELPTDRIIEVLLYKNIGMAKAVNIGLDISKSEYVAVLQNDVVINDKNWVAKAVDFLKRNKEAGLIDIQGWNFPDGEKTAFTSMKRRGVGPLDKDFVEVVVTDNIANVFKNDVRADERYNFVGTGIDTEIKGRGLKLYVMNFKDATHIRTSSRNLDSYKKMTSFVEEARHQHRITRKKYRELGMKYECKIDKEMRLKLKDIGRPDLMESTTARDGFLEEFVEKLEPEAEGIIEIGTYNGIGTVVLASIGRVVYTYDIASRDAEYVWNLFGVRNRIRCCVAPQWQIDFDIKVIVERWQDKLNFNLAVIDGKHDESVRHDFELVKFCGRVLFHDAFHEPIHNFINEIGGKHIGPKKKNGRCMWGYWEK